MMKKNRIQNVHSTKTTPINLVLEVSELRNKPEVMEQLSLGRKRKRVAFNLNVTTYKHVPVHESIESLPGCAANEEEKPPSKDDDDFVTSSVGLYSDDDEDVNTSFLGHQVWTESVLNASMESRDKSDYFNSVRTPVENILQWKAAKSKGTSLLKPQKENSADFNSVRKPIENILQWKAAKSKGASANFNSVRNPVENIVQWNAAKSKGNAPCKKSKSSKNSDVCPSLKEFRWRTNARNRSGYVNSVRNPVENISQWKAAKSKGTFILNPQKENSVNFEAPRLSFGQTPSRFMTKSNGHCFKKPYVMEQDKKVKWHSTLFETRLDRALNRGAA